MTTCFGAWNLPWKLTARPQYWWFPIGISFSRGRFSGGYLSFRVLEVTFLRSLPYNMMLGLGWSINAVVPRQREDSLDQKQDESLGLQWTPLPTKIWSWGWCNWCNFQSYMQRYTSNEVTKLHLEKTLRVNEHTGSGVEPTMLIVFDYLQI